MFFLLGTNMAGAINSHIHKGIEAMFIRNQPQDFAPSGKRILNLPHFHR